ncbi:MAG: radical SAM protein [bacterium]|nr:radical SAM protein [bacterium]
MKIALINPPSLYVYGKIRSGNYCSFPLGLGYIASYVRQAGHTVRLFDPEPSQIPLENVLDQLAEYSPDIVGITSVTSNFMLARQIAIDVKKRLGCRVIMGGPHVNALPKSTLQSTPAIDAVIMGEGEIPTLALANYFDAHGDVDFRQVPGAAFIKDGKYWENPRAELIIDLDSLPYPARDLVDINLYQLNPHFQRGKKSATILSSRGCPSQCTFCANLCLGRKFRAHSPERLVGEMAHLVEKYGIRHFHIVDDCFTANPGRVSEICDLLLAKRLKVTWFIFGRVNTLRDESLLRKMKQAGCVCIVLGIETGDQRISDLMKKGTTIEMAEQCCRLLRKNRITYINSFIIGNEGDTEETVKATVALAKKLKSALAGINMMIPFPGTAIFQKYFKDFDNPDTNWDNWCAIGPDLPYEPRQTALSKSDVLRLTAWAYRQYYLNFFQLLRILAFARNLAVLKSYIKAAVSLLRQVQVWTLKSRQEEKDN